jgi:hypothetical protein
MLSLDDVRWNSLKADRRTRFDPRLLFLKLETASDLKTAWHELWDGLYHQGDVGEASYASVPHWCVFIASGDSRLEHLRNSGHH